MLLLEHIDTFVRYEVDFKFNIIFMVLLAIPYLVIVYIQCYGNQNYLGFAFVLYISALITGIAFCIWIIADYTFRTSHRMFPAFGYNSNALPSSITIPFFIFGIILNLLGTTYCFSNATTNEESLGYHHPSITLIMWVLTGFNILFSLLYNYHSSTNNALLLLQALIQSGLYQFAVYPKAPIQNKRFHASWCLKFMAQYNFVILVMQTLTSYLLLTIGQFTYLWFISMAITICYRVLCSILFIEHSIEIDYYSHNAPNNENDEDEEYEAGGFNIFYTFCGYGIGIMIVTFFGVFTIPFVVFVQTLVIIETALILSQVNFYSIIIFIHPIRSDATLSIKASSSYYIKFRFHFVYILGQNLSEF